MVEWWHALTAEEKAVARAAAPEVPVPKKVNRWRASAASANACTVLSVEWLSGMSGQSESKLLNWHALLLGLGWHLPAQDASASSARQEKVQDGR